MKKVISVLSLLAVLVFPAATVSAVRANNNNNHPNNNQHEKITICHRTDSVKNPYQQLPVDNDSADGNTDNDNGKGDHSEHTGPVPTSETQAQALKDAKENWGDIIPPHDNYAGLNWTAEGQAVYNNDCDYATPGGKGGEDTPTTPDTETPVVGGRGADEEVTTPTAAPQVTVTPAAVNAGEGGATQSATGAIAGLLASVAALGFGVRAIVRQRQ